MSSVLCSQRVTGLLQQGKYSYVSCSSLIPGCRITCNCSKGSICARLGDVAFTFSAEGLLVWGWLFLAMVCVLFLETGRGSEGMRRGQTSYLDSYGEVSK